MISSRLLSAAALVCIGGVAFGTLSLQEYSVEPTKEHKIVAKGVGHWEGTLKMWGPGSEEPEVAPCKETVRAIGDLWTVSFFESEAMGAAFTGSAVLGFDPGKQKFVGTWIDSMMSSITEMEGSWDAAKKAIVMEYDQDMGGMTMSMRLETVFSDNAYTASFYDADSDQMTMQIEMKRSKKAVEAGASK